MAGRRIRTTYEIITEESVEAGGFADSGWEDAEGVVIELDEYDIEDGVTIAEKAAAYIESEGYVEHSSSCFRQPRSKRRLSSRKGDDIWR